MCLLRISGVLAHASVIEQVFGSKYGGQVAVLQMDTTEPVEVRSRRRPQPVAAAWATTFESAPLPAGCIDQVEADGVIMRLAPATSLVFHVTDVGL